MTDKLEFASDAWLAALRELIPVYTKRAGPGLELSLCEVFLNVPAHLDKHKTGKIAWHCRIKDGVVDFREGEADDVDWKTTTDYNFILPYARRILDDTNVAEHQGYIDDGVSSGIHVSVGDRTKIPRAFYAMHNELAERTA
jgi:hypothetical protein